jgi:hypothetical protein
VKIELPDREPVLAVCADIHQTYQRSGFGSALAKFIAFVSYQGPLTPGYADQPAPDPAAFGLPAAKVRVVGRRTLREAVAFRTELAVRAVEHVPGNRWGCG